MNKSKYEEELVNKFDNTIQTKNNFSELMDKVDTKQYINSAELNSKLYKYVVLIVCNLLFIICCSISLFMLITSSINKDRRYDYMHEPHKQIQENIGGNQEDINIIGNITIIVDCAGGKSDEKIKKNTY